MKTHLAAIAFAALFSTVATQFYTLFVPTRSALWLLLLFFMVGLGVAWFTLRLDARDKKTTLSSEGASEASETTEAAPHDPPP